LINEVKQGKYEGGFCVAHGTLWRYQEYESKVRAAEHDAKVQILTEFYEHVTVV